MWIEWTAYLAIGAMAGLAAGFLGIGGGLIVVPALIAVFTLLPLEINSIAHTAIATSLGTILFTAPGAIITHHRKGAIDYPLVLRFLPTLILGALLGAWLASQLRGDWLVLAFGLYALLAGLRMLWPGQTWSDVADPPIQKRPGSMELSSTGALIGMLSSMVGIGGGSITVPYLSWRSIPIARAIAVAAVCGYPIAVGGVLGYVWFAPEGVAPPNGDSWHYWGFIYLPALLGIAAASIPAAPLGALLMHRLPAARVKRVFAVFLLLVAVRMLWPGG